MKQRRINCILMPLLLVTAVAGLCFGSAPLSFEQLLSAACAKGEETTRIILWQLRLPRVMAGMLAGIGLAVLTNDLAFSAKQKEPLL